MPDIDLIPLDYRTQILRLNMLKQFGIISMTILLLSISIFAVLGYTTHQLKSEVARLQKQKAITSQQRASLVQQQTLKNKLHQQFKLLKGLRSGAAVEIMFKTIDATLPDDVWFKSWKFQRAGLVEAKAKTVNSGYFIVVPQNKKAKKPKGHHVQTNMTITGQARDHSALSEFVRRLFQRPEIQDVRIEKTSLRRYSKTNVIDFDLAVIVNTRAKEN